VLRVDGVLGVGGLKNKGRYLNKKKLNSLDRI
jgi:hypothetical protein